MLPPIDTSQWRPETVDEHAEQVRQQFITTLTEWPVRAFDDGRMTRTMGIFEWRDNADDQ